MEVLQRTANRGSISTGYDIDNSCKFEADNSEQLSRDVSSAGNRDVGTISMWIKRTELSTYQYLCQFGNTDNDNGRTFVRFQNDDTLRIAGGSTVWRNTNRVFRDTSAWMHIVIAFDTTQSTANDRIKLYVNGVQETSFSSTGNPSQNDDLGINFEKQVIGYNPTDGGSYFSGYMAEICCQDGTASAPTEFGETDSDTGIWIPKDVSGVASGTNGFYLDFEDASNLGNDVSGGTDFTETNIAAADQSTDTPTNNFCTLNPLFTGFNSSVQLPTNGATQYGLSGGNQDLSYAGTMGVTKGKWYFENYINEVVSTYGARIYVGFHTFQQDYDGVQVGASTNGDALAVWQMDAGNYVAWNGGSRSITGSLGTVDSSGAGKFVGIALNLDDNQISFYYDGSAVTNGTNLALYNMGTQTDAGIFAIPVVQTKGSIQTANFGGYIPSNFISSAASDANGYGTFEYAPPSGYYALCTKNLAEYG
mgnify:CR=1 FL=1